MEFGMLEFKKRGKETTETLTHLNQESMRTLKERENYKYFGIFETDTSNRVERKNRKSITEEQENFSKPSSAVEILSKE